MTLLGLGFALIAFALFGLASDAHRAWYGARAGAARQRMRVAAWAALAISFAAVVAGRGWTMGPVVWLGLIMLAAGMVFLFLNFAPRPDRRAAAASKPRKRTE